MFGQIPDFTNGFEFLRRIWSAGGSLPGGGMMPGLSAMTPPMDLEEVDKRIHDLKAVEGWLQLNASLLRTTIQGLEVQRATLVALQTFGNALSPEALQTAMENVARAANAPSSSPPHPFRPAAAPETAPAPETVSEAEADAANAEDDDDFDAPPDLTAEAAEAAEGDEGDEPEAAPSPESAGPAPLPPNASLWWDLLQQQFSQIASSATAATTAPFGNLGGFGAMGGMGGMGAPGAEGVEPAARDNPDGKAPPKPAKAPSAKKPAAKKAAAKAAKPATKKPVKKPAAKKPAAKTPSAPGTPKDSTE